MTSFGASIACDLSTCILELLLILDPGNLVALAHAAQSQAHSRVDAWFSDRFVRLCLGLRLV
eukprot:5751715-Amphidinium_carterae.1